MPKTLTAEQPVPPQPPAVEARGEKTLTLEGVKYRLRPSREAIAAIEESTGRGLLKLVHLCSAGDLSTDDYGIVAAHLIRAGASPDDEGTRHVGEKRVADLIYEAGVLAVKSTLTLVLLNAATGGRTAEGNEKAATA